jgi:hypothetical protein
VLPPRDEAFIRGATTTFRLRLCPHGMQPPPEFGQIQQKDLDYWWLGEGLTELGDIMKIEVGHDDSSKKTRMIANGGTGWHLESVAVHNCRTHDTATFHVDRWLDKKEGDGKLETVCPDEGGSRVAAPERLIASVQVFATEIKAGLGLYPTVTFQYSSTTLYQFSYHIR